MAHPSQRPMKLLPGAILDLAEGEWEHGDGPLRIRVTRVLDHLSRYYDGRKIWIQGVRLDPLDQVIEQIEVLVRTDALPRAPTNGRGPFA